MTLDEAIKILKDCELNPCVPKDKEAAEMAIKALEQEPILDKIIAEIESCREDVEPHLCDYKYHRNDGLDIALDIIDKYKAERSNYDTN